MTLVCEDQTQAGAPKLQFTESYCCRLALQDIRLSLQAGYPAHLQVTNRILFNVILLKFQLQYKLHERRAKCCKEEKQFR